MEVHVGTMYVLDEDGESMVPLRKRRISDDQLRELLQEAAQAGDAAGVANVKKLLRQRAARQQPH